MSKRDPAAQKAVARTIRRMASSAWCMIDYLAHQESYAEQERLADRTWANVLGVVPWADKSETRRFRMEARDE